MNMTSQAATVSPLGAAEFEKMLNLMSALRMKDASVATHAAGLEKPLLRAAALVLAADVYVGASQREAAEELLNQAAAVLKAHEASALTEQLEIYRASVPRRTARIMLAETKKFFRDGQLGKGRAMVDEVLKQKLTRLEREEMRVLGEVADIMQVLRETLEKQGLCTQSDETTPEQLCELAAQLKGNNDLPAEMRSLAILLQGDYAGAFRADPHAAQSDSNEPFAVMMRDWKSRLEM